LRILITGASGFVGWGLEEQYAGKFEVFAPSRVELDLLDAERVRGYLSRRRIDAVIHADTEHSNGAIGARPDLRQRNCRMFFNLVRNEHLFGGILFLSSSEVHDRARCRAKRAEDCSAAHVPSDNDGFAKCICAKATEAMERVYEVRLFGVFGPYEDWRVRFISKACCRAVWDMPVVIRQDVLFDYMDIVDLGWALEALSKRDLCHKHYNICTGRSFALSALAEKVVRISGKGLGIVIQRPGMGREYSGDNARMLDEIPRGHFRDMDGSIADLFR
jgi:GDP-L-fucose synthase